MLLSMIAMVCLALNPVWADPPDGRWNGTITYGTLKVPFVIFFESNGKSLKASLVNGDTRVSTTEGSFEAGKLSLTFASGSRLEATLEDGQLKGTYGSEQKVLPFAASKFCECGPQGEAGSDISGSWEVPDSNLRLKVQRKGDDTLAVVSRPDGELGPLTGRSDGLTFLLSYFDGVRAAVLEIEERKDGGLDLKLMEPGSAAKTYRAIKVKVSDEL